MTEKEKELRGLLLDRAHIAAKQGEGGHALAMVQAYLALAPGMPFGLESGAAMVALDASATLLAPRCVHCDQQMEVVGRPRPMTENEEERFVIRADHVALAYCDTCGVCGLAWEPIASSDPPRRDTPRSGTP